MLTKYFVNITLLTKVHLVKAMVFPVVMYGCESWTIKQAESQRMDACELWCWWRLLRVPWTARRSNQSILKESVLNINWKDWCWSWYSNILATWAKNWLIWKDPDAGKDWREKKGGEGDDRGWDVWMTPSSKWTWVWANSGIWWKTGKPGVLQAMGSQSRTGLTELNRTVLIWPAGGELLFSVGIWSAAAAVF